MLTDFEKSYATAILGADALCGGDVAETSGANHFVAHLWTSGEPLPGIFDDPSAQELRTKEGYAETDPAIVKKFVQDHHLLELTDKVIEDAPGAVGEKRASVIARTMRSVGLMIRLASARAMGNSPPSFEEMYTAATGETPLLHSPAEVQERLRAGLATLGVEVTTSQSLLETFIRYQKEHQIPSDRMAQEMVRINAKLRSLSQQNVLSPINAALESDGPECKMLDGVFFTGVSLYHGGEDEHGRPLYKGSIGYNSAHPVTEPELVSFLAHEGWPGHYMAFAMTDMARRQGNLGFEASMLVIGAPEATLAEGWGQCALQMAFGGTREAVINTLGPQYNVLFALEDLDEIARHNGAISHQIHRVPLDQLRDQLRQDYVQPDHMVKKLSGAWAKDPIIGPTWSSLYLTGGNTIRESLREHGLVATANCALNRAEYVDHVSFRKNMGLRE